MIKYRVPEGKMNFNITRMECIKAVSSEASYSWELKFQRRGQNEDICFLGFVLLCTRCWLFSGGNWKWLGQHGRWIWSRKTSRVSWIKKNNYKWWLKKQNRVYKGAKYKDSLLFLRDEEEDIKLWRELAIPSMTLHCASIGNWKLEPGPLHFLLVHSVLPKQRNLIFSIFGILIPLKCASSKSWIRSLIYKWIISV